jgi:hypothetical protein
MNTEPTPLVLDADESSLIKSAIIGVLSGIVVWGVLGMVAVRIGWPQESWGFAVTIGAFSGLWGGPFFGSAAGIAAHQLKVDARERAEAATHSNSPAGGPAPAGIVAAAVPTV